MIHTKSARASLLPAIIILASCCLYIACNDDSSAVKERAPDAGTTSGGTSGTSGGTSGANADGGDAGADCFTNPTTHFEIINACTTATRITKNPTLSKILPDGGLPPLD